MIYELPLEKLQDFYTRIPCLIGLDPRFKNKELESLIEEFTYLESCYFLKLREIPREWPEIKEAERLYEQGNIEEANDLLYAFCNNLDFLSSIEEKEVKYAGN